MIVKRRSGSVSSWCSSCGSEVVMLTPDEAASITSATTRTLYRMVDAGVIHFAETDSGLIRLCISSLLQVMAVANQNKQLLPEKTSQRELESYMEVGNEDE